MTRTDGDGALSALLELLDHFGRQDAEVWERVRAHCAARLATTDEVVPAAPPGSRSAPTAEPPPEPTPAPRVERTLTIGGRDLRLAVPDTGTASAAPTAPAAEPPEAPPPRNLRDLDPTDDRTWAQSSARLALKVRALDKALGRLPDTPVASLFEAASSLPECYLWPLDPAFRPGEEGLLELARETYRNLYLAVASIRRFLQEAEDGEAPDEAWLQLMARAQSAVFDTVRRAGLRANDRDQVLVFGWIRDQTSAFRIFLPRYMNLQAVERAEHWAEAREALEALVGDQLEREGREKNRGRLLGRLHYHLGKLREAADRGADTAHHRDVLLACLEEWVTGGEPWSDTELRAALDEGPDPVGWLAGTAPGPGAAAVLGHLEAWRAERAAAAEDGPGEDQERPEDPLVAVARTLVEGKVLLMLCGNPNEPARARLEERLGLAELRWPAVEYHANPGRAESALRRPDVDLVVSCIRFNDHAHTALKEVARELERPFVVLPAGYGLNRVAHALVEQLG